MDPTKASRPGNSGRDGFVMGEGAEVLLLEELEHVKQRGATIYAEFLGGSFTCDAHYMTKPHPEGTRIILRIEKALAQSGVSKDDVNYINAHATSTQAGYLKEYSLAIKRYFIQYLMDIFGPELSEVANTISSFKLARLLESAIRSSNAQYDDFDILDRLRVKMMSHRKFLGVCKNRPSRLKLTKPTENQLVYSLVGRRFGPKFPEPTGISSKIR